MEMKLSSVFHSSFAHVCPFTGSNEFLKRDLKEFAFCFGRIGIPRISEQQFRLGGVDIPAFKEIRYAAKDSLIVREIDDFAIFILKRDVHDTVSMSATGIRITEGTACNECRITAATIKGFLELDQGFEELLAP